MTSVAEVALRAATAADADAIADLHATSWQDAYRGVLPDHHLAGPIFEDGQRFWRQAMSRVGPDDIVLVAEQDGRLIAFVAARQCAEAGYDALIAHLHVRPELRRRGLGRRLLGAVAERLGARGHGSACLWVYDANEAAIRFYERLGGCAEEHGFEDVAGTQIAQTRLVWRDLEALAAACRDDA